MTRVPSRRELSNYDSEGGEEYDLNGVVARVLMDAADAGEWEYVADYGDTQTPWTT